MVWLTQHAICIQQSKRRDTSRPSQFQGDKLTLRLSDWRCQAEPRGSSAQADLSRLAHRTQCDLAVPCADISHAPISGATDGKRCLSWPPVLLGKPAWPSVWWRVCDGISTARLHKNRQSPIPAPSLVLVPRSLQSTPPFPICSLSVPYLFSIPICCPSPRSYKSRRPLCPGRRRCTRPHSLAIRFFTFFHFIPTKPSTMPPRDANWIDVRHARLSLFCVTTANTVFVYRVCAASLPSWLCLATCVLLLCHGYTHLPQIRKPRPIFSRCPISALPSAAAAP